MKYRIVFRNEQYHIQKRGFIFWKTIELAEFKHEAKQKLKQIRLKENKEMGKIMQKMQKLDLKGNP